MQITVYNLGPLRQAEIALKPLTVFVGKNNTGKTWLAYTIAGALGRYSWGHYLNAYLSGQTREKYRPLDSLVRRIAEQSEGVIDLVTFADEHAERFLNDLLARVREWLPLFLGSDHARFDELVMRIDIAAFKPELLRRLLQTSISDHIGRDQEDAPLKALKESGEARLYFYPGQNVSERLPRREIASFVNGIIFREILRAFWQDISYFPTERSSIIYERFISLPPSARNKRGNRTADALGLLERLLAALSEQPPRLVPMPIAAFVDIVWRFHRQSSLSLTQEPDRVSASRSRYLELATLLQEEILEGTLDFRPVEAGTTREILFSPAAVATASAPGPRPELELSVSSSMVKELSSLALYLRYLAHPGELLVIDEPEMNLHPEAQVKLIELLAMLVNAGLHIMMTTHSTYMIDHLINLLAAARHPRERHDELASLFLLRRKEAFLSQERVAVYHIRDDGEAANILDEEGIIHWRTFSEVTRLVERIHFALAD
ncbi:AAA family ATPase [Thermogemmatispora sp.]|uniref:AAA family ATPase n=1 Tax=Thermogemmatispora sp. TaxID=1968838 RepID=UPI001D872713|nr:AAA family ATPase [Thermogemmatispora sp.]MBX5449945.1 AAA family ATPase [Thermogemmatispora sp.]